MADILMPKATAVWLIDNTTLTFKQVADFCGLHTLEVKGIAGAGRAAAQRKEKGPEATEGNWQDRQHAAERRLAVGSMRHVRVAQ